MREPGAMDAFAGVAFHCYGGNVAQQDSFYSSFPAKELYFTECTGVPGSDWWSDIQVSRLIFSSHFKQPSTIDTSFLFLSST